MKFNCLLILGIVGLVFAQNNENLFVRYADTCNNNGKKQICYGFMDPTGHKITSAKYFQIDYERVQPNKAYAITFSGKFVAIGIKGEELFEFYPYDNDPDKFYDGLARYIENKKVGFVDSNYKKVIEAQYDFATPFNFGIAAFCIDCKEVPIYPIDLKTEKEIIEKYPEHFRFSGGKWGFINKRNEIVVNPILDDVHDFDSIKVVTIKNKIRKEILFSNIRKTEKASARKEKTRERQ